jgi:DNA polymerase III epsilon subunit-like protein
MTIDPTICFFSVDIEASGPIPAIFSMLSIGACLVEDDQATFKRLLKPISDSFDPKAMEVSKMTLTELRASGLEPKIAMTEFREWIIAMSRDRIPVFVGLNAAFDWSFVNYYFHRYLSDNPFGFAPLDIKAFYAGVTGSTWMDAKSSKMTKKLGATKIANHDALEDAVAQAELFRLTLEHAANHRR